MMNSLLEGTNIFSRTSGLAQPPFAVELAYEREFPKQLHACQFPRLKFKYTDNHSLVENTGALTTFLVQESKTFGSTLIGTVITSTLVVTNNNFILLLVIIIIMARHGAGGGSRGAPCTGRGLGGRNIDRDSLGFGNNASITLVHVSVGVTLDVLSALILWDAIRVVRSELREYDRSTEMHGELILTIVSGGLVKTTCR